MAFAFTIFLILNVSDLNRNLSLSIKLWLVTHPSVFGLQWRMRKRWKKSQTKIGKCINVQRFEVSYAHQGCIYLIKKWFLFEYMLKCNLFLWYTPEFSASLLQSSVSHDPSEIMLICCLRNILIIISVKNICVASYFCGNCDNLFLDYLINIKFRRTEFTVTFDQCKASLMNKSITFILTPNFLTCTFI